MQIIISLQGQKLLEHIIHLPVTLFNRKIVVTYQITGMHKAWHGGPCHVLGT